MSNKALPFLFVNLGGEMVYILHQRLNAQNIDASKARKVLNDIIGTMFNRKFMDELFKPQELHSKKAMRTVFDRLAHASIMKLNAASMDKLYDLMTMAVKYQTSLVSRPRDLLFVTLNHVDGVKSMIDTPSVLDTMDNLFSNLIQHYAGLSHGEFLLARQSLLAFFQDNHVRVSIFLKENQQNQAGRFVLPKGGPVPCGCDIPGTIKLYDKMGKVKETRSFYIGGPEFTFVQREGSLELKGNRLTKLGTNMYSNTKPSDTTTLGSTNETRHSTPSHESSTPDPFATAQLDLLSRLIGGSSAVKDTHFKLNLFNTDAEEEHYAASGSQIEREGTEFLNIDARRRDKDRHLAKVMGELEVSEGGRDDDLLDLMDQA